LSEQAAQPLFQQVVSAVAHCHRRNIVLRDLKLGKIFFSSESREKLVIADLDGAKVLSNTQPLLTDQKGSPAYVSPEVLICRPYDGKAADVWGLGVVLFVMLTGTYPFQDRRPAKLFEKIQLAWHAVKFPETLSTSALKLIKRLLSRDPKTRPSIEDLVSHPWVRGETAPATPCLQEAPEACPEDHLVPDVGSPLPCRKAKRPLLAPLVIRPAQQAAAGTPASPMSGTELAQMWPALSSSSRAASPTTRTASGPSPLNPAHSQPSAKRSRRSIEDAFAFKAFQPKMSEWSTVSSVDAFVVTP
jgi:serine/threonine protein kinase